MKKQDYELRKENYAESS